MMSSSYDGFVISKVNVYSWSCTIVVLAESFNEPAVWSHTPVLPKTFDMVPLIGNELELAMGKLYNLDSVMVSPGYMST